MMRARVCSGSKYCTTTSLIQNLLRALPPRKKRRVQKGILISSISVCTCRTYSNSRVCRYGTYVAFLTFHDPIQSTTAMLYTASMISLLIVDASLTHSITVPPLLPLLVYKSNIDFDGTQFRQFPWQIVLERIAQPLARAVQPCNHLPPIRHRVDSVSSKS
jgi:hypothetical protein